MSLLLEMLKCFQLIIIFLNILGKINDFMILRKGANKISGINGKPQIQFDADTIRDRLNVCLSLD